jgi:predicted RNA binding protein YcfA (HicA-like mRNA interferase family)
MNRLPALTYRDVVAQLRAHGFQFARQAKGSHEVWHNPVTNRVTTVPCHPGDIPRGTLRAIIAQTGLTVEEFLS